MSKICPNCKREIDENVKFCPFCAAFTGETPQEKKKSPVGAIIGGAAGVLALGACCLPRKTQKVGNHGISRN